jgi:hypothetical protein
MVHGIPNYSDAQIAFALLLFVFAAFIILVAAPTSVLETGMWLARRQPPVNRFVRFCMVTTVTTTTTVLLISGYGELVSPGSGLPFYVPAVILSLAGVLMIAFILRFWTRSIDEHRK